MCTATPFPRQLFESSATVAFLKVLRIFRKDAKTLFLKFPWNMEYKWRSAYGYSNHRRPMFCWCHRVWEGDNFRNNIFRFTSAYVKSTCHGLNSCKEKTCQKYQPLKSLNGLKREPIEMICKYIKRAKYLRLCFNTKRLGSCAHSTLYTDNAQRYSIYSRLPPNWTVSWGRMQNEIQNEIYQYGF